MELWDILDENGEKTGRVIERGKPLKKGEYHLVVDSWIMDGQGRFLITRRSPEKSYAGLWEPTTGSAIAGEDSFTAVHRETLEETGLDIKRENTEFVGRYRLFKTETVKYFRDVYLIRQDFELSDVRLQPGETDGAKKASAEDIRKMIANGTFLPGQIVFYTEELFERARIQSASCPSL